MIRQSIKQHILQYQDSDVFVVLDGAAIPDLLDQLYADHGPEFKCLYSGELSPDMAEVAPYLVKLGQSPLFDAWVYDGWGCNWGIYAIVPKYTELFLLHRHFRKLNKIYSASNEPLYFRYYDPSVLQRFLPSATANQLQAMFGPVSTYITEVEHMPTQAFCFNLEGNYLRKKQLAIKPIKDMTRF